MVDWRRPRGDRASADTGERVYRLDIMTQDDVPAVGRVERRCFPNPWPASAYRRELQNPAQNYYVVLRAESDTDDDGSAADAEATDGSASRSLPRRSLLPIGLPRRHADNGVARSPIAGFAGMWMAFDEAHVTTIGVDPRFRGFGFGELLLLCMVDEAIARGANWLTLEVRISNEAAQGLYRKYAFTVQGTRKRYYSDNNEDALIMWSPALSDPAFRALIERQRMALIERLAPHVDTRQITPVAGPLSRAATP